jgi:hypothetical protein
LVGGVVGELLLVTFTAGGALAARETPLAEAERTSERQSRGVPLRTQDADLRRVSAVGAAIINMRFGSKTLGDDLRL